jgi:hypothetical protein
MAVRYFYVDESYTQEKFCLSALSVRHSDWHQCFNAVKDHRKALKDSHGIFIRKEIHARELVTGRGNIAEKIISKGERVRVFYGLLRLIANLPTIWLFNVVLDSAGRRDVELDAWERLLNRIERTTKRYEDQEQTLRNKLISQVSDKLREPMPEELETRILPYLPRSMIISDEGRERELTAIFRKMNVFNPIPSAYGGWGATRDRSRNIPLGRIIEDPVFKKSHQSFFIQLADCVSFALLKREVPPTAHVQKYKLNEAFDACLAKACFKAASPKDPLGIVRK